MDRVRPRAYGVPGGLTTTTAVASHRLGGRAAISEALAHELLTPLSSAVGCAETLLDHADDLPTETRVALTEAIARQVRRLAWLVRAASAEGRRESWRIIEPVDAGEIVLDAARAAGLEIAFRTDGPVIVEGDRRRLRLAIEALLFALADGGARVSVTANGARGILVMACEAPGLGHEVRRWKVSLGRRILREEGHGLVVRAGRGGVKVTVRFAPASTEGE